MRRLILIKYSQSTRKLSHRLAIPTRSGRVRTTSDMKQLFPALKSGIEDTSHGTQFTNAFMLLFKPSFPFTVRLLLVVAAPGAESDEREFSPV
jgi:hypothetical protein